MMNNAKVYYMKLLACYIDYKGVVIKQADWDSSKVRAKVSQDIDSHISDVRDAKISDLTSLYEVTIKA